MTSADDGDYSVVVSNVLGSDTSTDAALTVAAVPQCKIATCDPVLGCVLADALDGTPATTAPPGSPATCAAFAELRTCAHAARDAVGAVRET